METPLNAKWRILLEKRVNKALVEDIVPNPPPPGQNHTSPELISLDLLQDVRTSLTAEKAEKPAERAFQAAMLACLGRSTEVHFYLSPAQFW